jgi:hypothetical protein
MVFWRAGRQGTGADEGLVVTLRFLLFVSRAKARIIGKTWCSTLLIPHLDDMPCTLAQPQDRSGIRSDLVQGGSRRQ